MVTSTNPPADLVDAREIARRLGVSRQRVFKLKDAGRLPFYRLGKRQYRFSIDEVLKLLRREPQAENANSHAT